MKNSILHSDYIFNSALETGIRIICILTAAPSKNFDLQELLAFDHLIVHSGDVDSNLPSLHPNILQRNGELLIRRAIIEDGLILMEQKRLIRRIVTTRGFYYCATDLACSLIDSLTNKYIDELIKRATWAVNLYNDYGDELFSDVLHHAFDRWKKEFQLTEFSITKN